MSNIKLETGIGGGESSNDHVGFGIGFDEIVRILVSDFDDVVTH
jgi:hypothetical protein